MSCRPRHTVVCCFFLMFGIWPAHLAVLQSHVLLVSKAILLLLCISQHNTENLNVKTILHSPGDRLIFDTHTPPHYGCEQRTLELTHSQGSSEPICIGNSPKWCCTGKMWRLGYFWWSVGMRRAITVKCVRCICNTDSESLVMLA